MSGRREKHTDIPDIHVHIHTEDERISKVLALLTAQSAREDTIMADLSNLEAEVEANTSVTESVKTLVQRLADEIAAASGDQEALDALVAQLRANDGSLADLVTANTPPPAPTPSAAP